jgi:hypothetical protein
MLIQNIKDISFTDLEKMIVEIKKELESRKDLYKGKATNAEIFNSIVVVDKKENYISSMMRGAVMTRLRKTQCCSKNFASKSIVVNNLLDYLKTNNIDIDMESIKTPRGYMIDLTPQNKIKYAFWIILSLVGSSYTYHWKRLIITKAVNWLDESSDLDKSHILNLKQIINF